MRNCKYTRVICAFLAAMLAVLSCCLPVFAAGELSLASEAAVLIDAATGQVLYEKNMHAQMYPASITKIMTGLIAMDTLEPQKVLTVSASAVNAVPRTSSHIGLSVGEELTVEQLMYALGMESANDAANVLAEAISGSLDAFAQRMTEEARKLGAKNTHFTNANGLPDSQHYTTAYDMALITAAALKKEGFTEYFSTVEYLLPRTNRSDARVLTNKDRLLPGGQYYYEGVVMAKTGFTNSAQGTFAAAVQRGNTTLIVIALKSPLLEDKYRDTRKLMDYGFTRYTRLTLTAEQLAARISFGEYEPVEAQQISYLLPSDVDRSGISFALAAPLPEGQDRVTAVVRAKLGDTQLPDMEVFLESPLFKTEAEPTALDVEELLEETVEEIAGLPWRTMLTAGAGLVVFLWLFNTFRRWHQRRTRRRELQARIRRMKRRMEKK